MNDFSVQKEIAKEKMFEAVLEYAGACCAENIISEIEEVNGSQGQIPFSTELDKRIKRLIVSYNRKSRIEKGCQGASRIFKKVVKFLHNIVILTI